MESETQPADAPPAEAPARGAEPAGERPAAPESGPGAAAATAPASAPVEAPPSFESSDEEPIPPEILSRRICDFDLRIEGRPLGRVIERFQRELSDRAITRLKPRFYLTSEWGVPEGTVAIGIPFYLADAKLLRVQRLRGGFVEGETEADLLRYLRHEMGHVVNYGYRLYATVEWTRLFGPMARPYVEDYRAIPFSPDYVRHLPGGYAQKHPDEDWAETFAVWMTPRVKWRSLYADSPGALAKLEYCEATLQALRDRDPEVVNTEIDLDASEISTTVQEYYPKVELGEALIPRSLDGDLQVIFGTARAEAPGDEGQRLGSGAQLLRRQLDPLADAVYLWTGVDPTLLRQLVGHLAARAAELDLAYPLGRRDVVLVELSGFLTTLAMNYVYRGRFIAS